MKTAECPYTGQARKEPETLVEHMAWALCYHDNSTGDGGYLSDEELEGLEMLFRAMENRCGSIEAQAQFLDCSVAAVRRYIWKIMWLMRLERARRDDNSPLLAAHLTAAFWPDYVQKAQIAFTSCLQDARVAKAVVQADRKERKKAEVAVLRASRPSPQAKE